VRITAFLTQHYLIMAGPLVLPERDNVAQWPVCTTAPCHTTCCSP